MNKRVLIATALSLALLLIATALSAAAAGTATLTVNFPGISGAHVYLYNSNGVPGVSGSQVASQTYKNNQAIFNSLPNGTYDVMVVQGAKQYIAEAIDCTGATCTVDNIVATLTVKFPGINGVHTYVKFGGGAVAESTYKNNDTVLTVLRGIYSVTVVQGAKQNIIDPVDCTSGTCLVENLVATLTVKFPGINGVHTYVKFGGGAVAESTYKNNETALTVLKGIYSVTVVQGAKQNIIDPVDCTSGACTVENLVATMTVKFPGINGVHTYAKVDNGAVGTATGGAVVESTYKNGETSLVLLKGVYDVLVVQGAKQVVVDAVNCTSGSCLVENLVATLTVKFPGINGVHTYVKFGSGAVIESTYKNNETTLTVLKGIYSVTVVQGAKQNVIDPVDCMSGTCTVDNLVATLTVKFPGINGAHTYVKVDNGGAGTATGGAVIESTYKNNETSIVLLKGIYDVVVVQGAKQNIVDAVNCTSGTCTVENIVATLTVKFTGFNGVHTYAKTDDGVAGTATGGAVAESTYKNNETSLVLLRSFYDVILNYGGKNYIWDSVNCTGATCTLDKSTLTVDFPDISSVHVYVYNSNGVAGTVSGAAIASQTWKNNQAVFTGLTNGKYDVAIVKGGKTLIMDDVIVFGNFANAGNIIATLTVKFPGISSVHTYVKVDEGVAGAAGGAAVDERTWKNDQTSLNVLKGTYDVVVVKGATQKIIDAVNCTGATCLVDGIVATLTVDFPGISSVHTYVKVNDGGPGATGGAVDERTWKNDTTSLAVLKNSYDVVVVKGAKSNIVNAVDCTGATCTVGDLVATLTVNFPGISDVHTYVKLDDGVAGAAGGGAVDERTWKNETTSLAVLKGTYDVLVVKGAKQKVVDTVNCNGTTCLVDGIVATLTVKFPGLSSVHTYVKVNDGVAGTAAGRAVDERTWKTNETSLAVLKNTYDVVIVKGAKQVIVDAVDCTGATCVVENLVSTFTLNFPGKTSVHVYLKLNDGATGTTGAAVDERTWQNNATTFAVLKNTYDLVVTVDGANHVVDAVDCTGNTSTYTLSIVKLLNSSGGGISGGTVKYYDGTWRAVGNTNGGGAIAFVRAGTPANLLFSMDYAFTHTEKWQNMATNIVVVFQTKKVEVQLKNSSGAFIDTGTVKYYTGAWHDLGATSSGKVTAELLPSNILFSMDNSYVHNEKWQDVGSNPTVVFQTKNVEVQLQQANGSLFDSGTVRYYTGAWHNLGDTSGGKVNAELLPANILFGMTSDHVYNEKWQDTGSNATVVFKRVNVQVQLQDSSGNPSGSGTVRYYTGAWHDLGTTTDGTVSKELLPANILFSISAENVYNEKWQNTGSNATVVFKRVNVQVQLQDRSGNPSGSGTVRYYTGAWHDLGTTTDGTVSKELLPANILFSISAENVYNEKWQNTGSNATVVFKRVLVVVNLKNSGGSLIPDSTGTGTVRYYTGAWHDFGTTSGGTVSKELLPANILFSMNYAGGYKETWQNTSADATVDFQTGKVNSSSNTCTQYYAGSWNTFTQGMELLPVTFLFHFTDGTGDTWYAVPAGSTINIH